MGNLDDLAFAVAIDEQVGLAIDKDRASHSVGPIIEMRDAAQRSLDTADDNGHIFKRFPHALRVDNYRAIRTFAAGGIRRVGIVVAQFAIRRVAVDHRVHIAGGDAKKQIGFAQRSERCGALPVGLRDDTNTKALRFQHAPDHRHAKTGMIDVGIARHQNDVATVPPECVHLGA